MLNLASAVALLIVGANLDVDAGVVAEGRAGVTAVPSGSSEPGVFGILTPQLELRSTGHEAAMLLAYGARFYEAKIRSLPVGAPLILQTGTLTLTLREGPRFDATAHATASYGQADFAYPVFGLAQASRPVVSAPSFMSLAADLITTGRLTRLWTLQTAIDAVDRRAVGATAEAQRDPANMALLFPHQRSIYLLPSLIRHLTRRDDLLINVGASYQSTDGLLVPGMPTQFLGLVQVLSITEMVGWRARLSRGYDFHVEAGVAYNRGIDYPAALSPISPVSPVGAIDLTVHLVTRREITLRGQFGAVVEYFVDPVLATAGTRGTTFAHMVAFLPLNWTAGLDAIFSTRLTRTEAIGMGANGQVPDETALSVIVPVRHLISRNLSFETGARLATRAPYVGSSQFAFHSPEAWLYVMLTATSRTIPDYRPPSSTAAAPPTSR